MLPPMARAHCRIHVGERCLDDVLPGPRNIGYVVALVAVLALMAALLPTLSTTREWLSQRIAAQPETVATVQLSTPRVPTRPVEGLERIDLSVVVSNPSSQPIDNLSLEMNVLQPDGSSAMVSRQSHISLEAYDSRAIYWMWRVPAQLPAGAYAVQVRAFDSNGRPLSGDQPATTGLQLAGQLY